MHIETYQIFVLLYGKTTMKRRNVENVLLA